MIYDASGTITRFHTAINYGKRPDSVDYAIEAYLSMVGSWALPNTLLAGTAAMRAAGFAYLPSNEKETPQDWAQRRDRTFLYPGYADALSQLASRPFQREVLIPEAAPDLAWEMYTNADSAGTTLTAFAKAVFTLGLHFGLAHILPEMPSRDEDEPTPTLADEQEQGIRPYLCLISPEQVIGWRDAEGTLIQLRVFECAMEPNGPYGEKLVERIRVFEKTSEGPVIYHVHERLSTDAGWIEIKRGTISLDYIPLVTFYANKLGPMTGRPAMAELAWKNLEHWQSSSEQRNILHVARVPFLFGSGFTPAPSADPGAQQAANSELTLKASMFLTSPDPQSDVKWVEHTGAAIEAGRNDLQDLQAQMTLLGLRPLVERSGNVTATEQAIATAEAHGELRSWVRDLETALQRALMAAMEYAGVDVDEDDLAVDVFDDWRATAGQSTDEETLLKASMAGKITDETLWAEWQRRGMLSEEFDPELEAAQLKEEIPPLLAVLSEKQPIKPNGGPPAPEA